MKKAICSLAAAAMAAISLTGCKAPTDADVYHVYMPDGAPAIALSKFMHEGYAGADFTVVPNSSSITIAQYTARGDAAFAILPVNAAATLYNSGVDIVMLSVNTHGNLYIIGDGDAITPDDLKGKRLGVIGQGNVPEHALKMLLDKSGVMYEDKETPEKVEGKVTLTYVGAGPLLAPQLKTGQIDYGFLAEPAATTLSANLGKNIVMDVQAQWMAAYGGAFPQACLVVKKSIAEKSPEYVESFLAALEAADGWAEDHPAEALEAVKSHMDAGTESSLTSLTSPMIKRCNIKTVRAADAKDACKTYFDKLVSMSTVLGAPLKAAPNDGFYYSKAQ